MVRFFFKIQYVYNLMIALVLSIFCGGMASAQMENTSIAHAVRVLKNIDKDKTKEWAINTLEDVAIKDSSAYAMNCLGLAYMGGIGVQKDSTQAIKWLKEAGSCGYADSYHNLGTIFKYSRCGVKQNFEQAYNYYSIGAEKGSVTCIYDKGFMLYKGLGCSQNYTEAVRCFQTAAKYSHAPSLYMLGLCYRNGYGVERDMIQASYYLNSSATLGYRDAIDEIARPYAETYLHEQSNINDTITIIPNQIPIVNPNINDIDLFTGDFLGFVAMYDWSGQYILGKKPLHMSVSKQGKEITGNLILGVDTIPFEATIINDKELKFKKGCLILNERYTVEGPVKYKIEKMLFDIWNDKIRGRLNLYSLKQKEPERPMYFELLRTNTGNLLQDADGKYNRIHTTPNPFESDFKATFELLSETYTEIRIFNENGMLIWNQNLGLLGRGEHEIILSPNITLGTYVINIKAGTQNIHSIITKKR